MGYTSCAESVHPAIEKQLGGISHGDHYERYHHRRHSGHGSPDRAHLPVHRHALPGLSQQPGRDGGRGLRRSRRGRGEAAGGRQRRGE